MSVWYIAHADKQMDMTHSFDTEHAAEYGMAEAVLIRHLAFWIAKNRANGTHHHDGRTWTYNSVAAFAELFPYLSSKQVRRALAKLEEEGVLVTGNYNKAGMDRTTWYAFADESAFLPNAAHLPKRANAFAQEVEPICPDGQIHLPSGADLYQIETQIETTDGGGARAREGGDGHDSAPELAIPPAQAGKAFDPVAAFREAYPGYAPNTHQLVLLQSMTDEGAFASALRYWLENDHKPQSVGKLRDRYQRIARGEAGADGKIPERKDPLAGPTKSRDLWEIEAERTR